MTPQAQDFATGAQPMRLNTNTMKPSHIDLEAQSPKSPAIGDDVKSPISPADSTRFRKVARSNTAMTYRPQRRGQAWIPGQEPGIDVSIPNKGQENQIFEDCDITVIDFSQNDMEKHHLGNLSLGAFLKESRPEWSSCRWISVNGLSWDVIELLGRHKNLHRLAIEDLMNPRNRTKADWYSDHTYMVLPLQKLIHFHSDSDCDSDCPDWDVDALTTDRKNSRKKRRRRCWPFNRSKRSQNRKQQPPKPDESNLQNSLNGSVVAHMSPTSKGSLGQVRTLQRYHGGPNEERIDFMEKHSALASKSLGVGVEQVSIFLTADNTVISFFENSAEDIETPLIKRLSLPETILRRCSDASMVTQVCASPSNAMYCFD